MFDAICELPEYYQTGTEIQILRQCAPRTPTKYTVEGFSRLAAGVGRRQERVGTHAEALFSVHLLTYGGAENE